MNPKIVKQRAKKKEEKRKFLLELLSSVNSLTEFGNKLGVTRERARQLVRDYSLPYDKKQKVKERHLIKFKERDETIISDYQSGMTIGQISIKYKIHECIISKILKNNSIDISIGWRSNKQKRNEIIFCMYKQGVKRETIAKKFNIHKAHVYNICRKMFRKEGVFLKRGQHYPGLIYTK